MELASPAAKKRARIEIIPLIDIIFFLLATFVMVSLSMVKQRGINVNLPTASTASAEPLADQDVTLTIRPGGLLFWNKEPSSLPEIQARLAKHRTGFPDAKVSICPIGLQTSQRKIGRVEQIKCLPVRKV